MECFSDENKWQVRSIKDRLCKIKREVELHKRWKPQPNQIPANRWLVLICITLSVSESDPNQ